MKRYFLIIAAVLALAGCASMEGFGDPPQVAIYIGMSEAAFTSQTGARFYKPNTTATARGIYKQYVAASDAWSPSYIYFENGVLTAWQD